jgi:acetate kinase
MAVTLIINPGSSSKKFALFKDGRTILSMRFERNGQAVELCTEHNNEQKKCEGLAVTEYATALEHVLTTAIESNCITKASDITRVGVRVVAPGTYFQTHRMIDEVYLRELQARVVVAPLHIPTTVNELTQVRLLLPHAVVVGVSDSAFHSTLPPVARTYSIKREDTKRYDIYRFGYHGISCASVMHRLDSVVGKPRRVVIAHIGSGVSITAIRDGVSIDTSMGFSPGSGMVMGTRSGDIESGALLELMRVRDMDISETQQYLQTMAGLKGLAYESDFRHLLDRRANGDTEAIQALELFAYRFKKLLGGHVAALGGLDALIFTATAVERSPAIRSLLGSGLSCFGIELDERRNDDLINHDGIISTDKGPVTVALVRTQELDEMVRVTNGIAAMTVTSAH